MSNNPFRGYPGFPYSVQYPANMYPVNASHTSGLVKRTEPVISPEQLVSRFLKGVPLIFPNGDSFTNDELKDRIMLAYNEAEILIGCTINREQFTEKHAFDRNLYQSFIHIKSEQGPIISLEKLAIVASDRQNLFEIPGSWIEAANFHKRQINVIPLLAAYGLSDIPTTYTTSGAAFLTVLASLQWVPALWEITYTAGLSKKEGEVPIPVNELIGCIAAIDLLSEIAASNIFTSQSLSQDGLSQSSSGPGPNIYNTRIESLQQKRDEIVGKIKALFFTNFVVGKI